MLACVCVRVRACTCVRVRVRACACVTGCSVQNDSLLAQPIVPAVARRTWAPLLLGATRPAKTAAMVLRGATDDLRHLKKKFIHPRHLRSSTHNHYFWHDDLRDQGTTLLTDTPSTKSHFHTPLPAPHHPPQGKHERSWRVSGCRRGIPVLHI